MDNRTIEQVRANEDRLIDENIRLEKQIDLYKIIADEIRTYILQHSSFIKDEENNVDKLYKCEVTPLLEILDKAKESE